MKVRDHLTELAQTLDSALKDEGFLNAAQKAAEVIEGCLKNGGTVLVAGNGGSAAEAQHFSAELVGRFVKERRGLPSIALTVDTSILTAVANDYGYERVFARQVEALGKKGDVLVTLSTSGNSKNLNIASEVARKMGITVIALLGRDGGAAREVSDIGIVVPSNTTSRIQEVHLQLIHAICDHIDAKFA